MACGRRVPSVRFATVPGCERADAERAAILRLDAVPTDEGLTLRSGAVPDGGTVDVRSVCWRGGRRPDVTWGGMPEETAEVAVVTEVVTSDGRRRVHDIVLRLEPGRAGWHAGGPHTGGDAGPHTPPCAADAVGLRITVVALASPLPVDLDHDDDPDAVIGALADRALLRGTTVAAFPR